MTTTRVDRGASTGIARAALLVAGVTVAARVVGFARILVFARTVGPTCLGDTYYTANTIPNLLFDVVAGGALASLVVPLLAGPVDDRDDATADRTASALLTWTVLILLPVLVVGLLLARPVMSLLVGNGHPGCPSAAEIDVGARMLLVFLPQVVLYGIGIVLTGVLQSHRRFFAPAVAPLASSAVVIAAYLLFAGVAGPGETSLTRLTRAHELVLSVGTTVGVVALVLPLVPALRGTGRRLRPTLHFPTGIARSARRLAVAGAVVLASQDVATAVALRLANDRGADGAVVLFNLAWTVFLLPWAVLAVPIATAAFPTLVARWQRGDIAGYAAAVARTSRAVVAGCAAAAGILAGCAAPAARVVVLGAPGSVPPADLARAFVAFAPGLLGYGAIAHLSRVHYARGDARTPAVATAAGWAVAVVADIVLVTLSPRTWAAAALGLGTSAGMTLAAGWMAVVLGRAQRDCLAGVAATTAATTASAVVAAVAVAAGAAALPRSGVAGSIATTVALAAVAIGIFAALVRVLDRPTLRLLVRRGRAVA